MKFKAGDKVKVLDGSKIENYTGCWTKCMERYIGTIHEIKRVTAFSDDRFACALKGIGYMFDERGLELVEEAEQANEDEPEIKVDTKSNKEHFIKVASQVAHQFDDLIAQEPVILVALMMFSQALADELFDN